MKAIPCIVEHPEVGRHVRWVSPKTKILVCKDTWVPDDTHPLGGYAGTVILTRRLNLTKDPVPKHLSYRPRYEFSKERSA